MDYFNDASTNFSNSSNQQLSQLKLTEIKGKVGSLERLLEPDFAKYSNLPASSIQLMALPDDTEDSLPPNEDGRDLEPSPLASVDAAYEAEGDDDELLDLGIQMAKMRITEQIGGVFLAQDQLRGSIQWQLTFSNLKNTIACHVFVQVTEWLRLEYGGQHDASPGFPTLPPAQE
ncbi:hypothetical protein DSL72_004444 [Monilinia vaccinii-corymbosi]|uniref:Uncharacterized protein n=1 Tax=Monilinia vaccinii-corymbosi TaxID=61207 RepID=A0A8A3P3U3_9HELO|nr:hypothetical protein DSL72_004444 [Monilinia vaccinii-corymbosi]